MTTEKYMATPQYQIWRMQYYEVKKKYDNTPDTDINKLCLEEQLNEIKKLLKI